MPMADWKVASMTNGARRAADAAIAPKAGFCTGEATAP
jgi:hypothetical protein